MLALESADGTRFGAALAESPGGTGAGVVILPDVRGLYPFYRELADRFAQAGHATVAIDYFGRTAGLGPRGEQFEYMPHVVDQVEQFDARLTEAEIEHELHVYPGAPHSFFDKRYDEYADASADAWRRMLAFLERHGPRG